SNRKDFVATDTLVNLMTALNDPRIPAFFTNDANGSYSGGIVGAGNNYAAFSKPGARITSQGFEALMMDYVEVAFLQAEAVERGFISGKAADYYDKAIRASLAYWGASSAQSDTYLAQNSVAYNTAKGDWKQKIGTQKWIALYNRGWESWTEIRRLDAPKLNAPDDPVSDFPVRYTYPTQEKNLNGTNYAKASTSIGGDAVTTKLYWDKN
ncbi:MAG: SusD/RagB family nutrient-binding outer membrane lipoprotein, partial [Saprospiraceae bacterium]